MPADLALGVQQVVASLAASLAIKAIEGMCKWITRKLEERKDRKQLVEEGLEEAINQLVSEVSFFKSLSEQDAANGQDSDLKLKDWLAKLKEILSDAEDLLDEYATDVAVREMEIEMEHHRNRMAKVSLALKSCFCFRGNTGHEPVALVNGVKKIIVSLNNLQKKASVLGIKKSDVEKKSNLEWRQTTSTPETHPMVGRDDDMRRIKEALLLGCGLDKEEVGVRITSSSSSNQKPSLCILPIVGMGGMGKTTLARNLFNDDEMQVLFKLRVWVCVSENFEKSSILKKIIDGIYHFEGIKEPFKYTGLEQLEGELRKLVHQKKFLLVLDDIWNEEREKWELLVTPLQSAAQNSGGCTILITSRMHNIKDAIPGCMEAIRLEGLQEDDLGTVFERYAFCDSLDLNRVERERLESIGKDILKKLKGSPVAAKSIGTLLASNRSTKHWKDVAGSELWKVSTSQFGIIPILTLSYRYLDAHLKNFLIYFSLFPKDYEFEELKIVQLWMAHNSFQRQGNTQEVLEDVGRNYLKLLVGRSFLDYNDGLYTMHDLIHDTIQSVSAHDCCLLGRGSDIRNEVAAAMGVQHLSVWSNDGAQYMNENASKYKKLRTLMIRLRQKDDSCLHVEFSKMTHMTCLRVLVLKDCGMKELPESVGSLKHLRLLDLSENKLLGKLPESVGFLHNLLELNLERCLDLERLPSNTSRLVNLRYLYIDPETSVKGMGRLVSLRSNLDFHIRQESGLYIDELKCLNELQEYLGIWNLDLVRRQEDAEAADLGKKLQLETLGLFWSYKRNKDSLTSEMVAREEQVLEGLKPCQAIKDIQIYNYGGQKPPSWLQDTWLVSLMSISLSDINMENLPPSLSRMPFLEKLFITGAPKLKEMRWQTQAQQGVSDSSSVAVAFPMLEYLYLRKMPACEGLRIEEEAVSVILPRLKHLVLEGCLRSEERFPIQAPVLETLSMKNVPDCLSYLCSTGGGLPSLQELEIHSCSNITSADLSAMTSLKNLRIIECKNITACHLPPAPAAIKHLFTSSCPRMASLWLSFPALSIDCLDIFNCPNLLYAGTTPSTDYQLGYYCPRKLHISECSRDQLSRLLHAIYYTNLEALKINQCLDIEHFDDDDGEIQLSTALLQLNSLKTLFIRHCEKLQSLPPNISNKLLCLEEIVLVDCPLLSSLPKLRPLPSLRALEVKDCPQLENSPDVDFLISSYNFSRHVYPWF